MDEIRRRLGSMKFPFGRRMRPTWGLILLSEGGNFHRRCGGEREREIVPASAMMGIFGAAAQIDLALSAISGGLTHAITHTNVITMITIIVTPIYDDDCESPIVPDKYGDEGS